MSTVAACQRRRTINVKTKSYASDPMAHANRHLPVDTRRPKRKAGPEREESVIVQTQVGRLMGRERGGGGLFLSYQYHEKQHQLRP